MKPFKEYYLAYIFSSITIISIIIAIAILNYSTEVTTYGNINTMIKALPYMILGIVFGCGTLASMNFYDIQDKKKAVKQ